MIKISPFLLAGSALRAAAKARLGVDAGLLAADGAAAEPAADVRGIPSFEFLARPRGLPQKGEARLHRGVKEEATDWDTIPHLVPAMLSFEVFDDRLEGHAVKRVPRMLALLGHQARLA